MARHPWFEAAAFPARAAASQTGQPLKPGIPSLPAAVKNFNCIIAMKALGEEHRVNILRLLMKGETSVNDISEQLAMSQYNVSKHLRVLREAGLVEQKKHGQQRLYSLASEFQHHLSEGHEMLDLGCCQFDLARLKESSARPQTT